MSPRKKTVPPDGGWGWVIVLAYALNHLIMIPIMQNFGLIFKDTFAAMKFSATDGSIIINMNAAVSMFTGLINGPMLKYFGYRKVSFAGALFTTVGVILTSYARSFTAFLFTYGFITSLGMGMGMGSYPFALNLYFLKNRSKAAGIAMTITGLGPVVMPLLISFLIDIYGVTGAVLIIGSISAHSFIAACLLQPVKWHSRKEDIDEENGDATKEEGEVLIEEGKSCGLYDKNNPVMQSIISIDHDTEVQAIYGFDTPLNGSVMSLNQGVKQRRYSFVSYKSVIEGKAPFARSESEIKEEKIEDVNKENEVAPEKKKKVGFFKRILTTIVNIFDLTLLKDPIYVNIMLGMSLAVFAEINFSLLTPFILDDFHLTTYQIAIFLSTLSTADIIFRFIAPFIGDFLNKPARIMYMVSLLLLIATRFTLVFFESFYELLGVAIALGIAKGIRTVYWTLVIPNYVPIERLANAAGLQMVVNGLFIMAGGPVLGLIRDITGSYKRCIYVINIVTCMTLIMWTTELLYMRYKPKKNVEKPLRAT
ncbi:PREDICTED: monocarboxylate transporter 7-like [Nicrophorus vespilloides]|uniref:Monocarboxylate transporter 7-like n=1 Tax=Nicrophorus vespilloides TaxID=110193 RepID=A0ABM1MFQ6_NICVS|nr:PREDICTED: monocarboxylate transporter 7-like [Nicrophorus vespilloides]